MNHLNHLDTSGSEPEEKPELLTPKALAEQLSASTDVRHELVDQTLELLTTQFSEGVLSASQVEEYLPLYEPYVPQLALLREELSKRYDPKASFSASTTTASQSYEARHASSRFIERVYVLSDEDRKWLHDTDIFKRPIARALFYVGTAAVSTGVVATGISFVASDATLFGYSFSEVGATVFASGSGLLSLGIWKACWDFCLNERI